MQDFKFNGTLLRKFPVHVCFLTSFKDASVGAMKQRARFNGPVAETANHRMPAAKRRSPRRARADAFDRPEMLPLDDNHTGRHNVPANLQAHDFGCA